MRPVGSPNPGTGFAQYFWPAYRRGGWRATSSRQRTRRGHRRHPTISRSILRNCSIAPIGPRQLRLSENVALHRGLDFRLRGAGREPELAIERREAEVVMVHAVPLRRRRTSPADLLVVVAALDASGRRTV